MWCCEYHHELGRNCWCILKIVVKEKTPNSICYLEWELPLSRKWYSLCLDEICASSFSLNNHVNKYLWKKKKEGVAWAQINNNTNKHLYGSYYVPRTLVSALHILTCFSVTKTRWGIGPIYAFILQTREMKLAHVASPWNGKRGK